MLGYVFHRRCDMSGMVGRSALPDAVETVDARCLSRPDGEGEKVMHRRTVVLLALLLASAGLAMVPATLVAQGTDETAAGVSYALVAESPGEVDGATFQLYRFRFEVITDDVHPKIPFPTTDSAFPEGYPESVAITVRTGPFVLYVGDQTDATLVTSRPGDIYPLVDKDESLEVVDFEQDNFDQTAAIAACSGSGRRTCALPPGTGVQLEAADVVFLKKPTFCLLCFLRSLKGDIGQIEVAVVVPDGESFSWTQIEGIESLVGAEPGVPATPDNGRVQLPALNPGPPCNGRVA
jgi:hypothetical protein